MTKGVVRVRAKRRMQATKQSIPSYYAQCFHLFHLSGGPRFRDYCQLQQFPTSTLRIHHSFLTHRMSTETAKARFAHKTIYCTLQTGLRAQEFCLIYVCSILWNIYFLSNMNQTKSNNDLCIFGVVM